MGTLTTLRVRNLKSPGRYTDGAGLMLVIGADGSRKWVLRIQANGKRRDIGLGSAADVTLSDARDKAGELRKAFKEGRDPLAEQKAARAEVAAAEEADKVPTFAEAAKLVHKEHLPSWKNPKHGAQWLSTLEAHAFPHFGKRRVDEITGPMVRDALAEIWLTVPETARRVRQRIGTVLDWAHAKGYRPAEAPMRAVSKGLPRQPKERGHFAAMKWQEVPEFLEALKATTKAGEPVRLAVEFLILTAVRSGEMRGARWNEFDTGAKEWLIPAKRMKIKTKSHTVPLSGRALAILARMKELRRTDEPDALVFEGERSGRALSDMTLTMLLRRMETGVTAHGFRSSFRDWISDATNFPREVAEAALAHALESKVEAAYARSDLLEKRRKLMEGWAGYCSGASGKVVTMSRKSGRR